ncbi:MAG: type I 3-dehydroquinate dehydratase [Lachnospiraceae bacterium]|nr:type I 3-dehydroquinate dehydratase [Lachnospiraceae bacterium]
MINTVYTPVTVRSVTLGLGRPKICVPLTGTSPASLEQQLKVLAQLDPRDFDLIEWRADCYEPLKGCYAGSDRSDIVTSGVLMGAADLIRRYFPQVPLLFTIRTSNEGGCFDVTTEDYADLNTRAASLGQIDLIDVEYFTMGSSLASLLGSIHSLGKPVVLSSHDFEQTPSDDEMLSRLQAMQSTGADIIKLAVMPRCSLDTMRLMNITHKMRHEHATCPLITMSMGPIGAISRLSGELTGSCVTFAAAAQTSAPGQMPAGIVHEVLELLKVQG